MKEISENQKFVARAILKSELQEESTGYYVRIDSTNIFLFFHYNRYWTNMLFIGAYLIAVDGGFTKLEVTNYLPASSWSEEMDLTITPVEKEEEEAE